MLLDWLINPFSEFQFMQRALAGCLALCLSAPPIGVFLMLRRMSLTGDAMSHAILPGAAVGYLVAGLSVEAMTLGGLVAGGLVVVLSGLVSGLNVTARAVGEVCDDVLTSIPIYPPFLSAPKNQDRTLSKFTMVKNGDRWGFDIDAFEKAITPKTKMFILCNPHNPLGRIFSKEELLQVAEMCEKHDMIICSDEIHCDLLLDQTKQHIPTAALSPEIAERTITLMAPSKTFNIAGIGLSFAIISNEKLRNQFHRAMQGIVPHPNLFGYTAALAAYRDSNDWLAELLDYLSENEKIVQDRINNIPGLSTTPVEATYLAWTDARDLPVDNPHQFFEDAGVGLSNGRDFHGRGFVRLNFGCPRAMLIGALDRMQNAVSNL